ncbi:MAG: hypothetical protein J6X89_07810 [Bacteroidales bacterium]|nr:hypothetical protein [Bacteroidales bacterium]
MKYLKIFSILAVACLLFACNKQEYPEFSKGPKDAKEKVVVYFPTTYVNAELDPADNTFDITAKRSSTEGALSVPVTVTDANNVFSAPASIDFADGDDTAVFTVDITKMELETPYELTVTIPNDYYYLYQKDQNSTKHIFHMSVLKQKWNDAGYCVFYDGNFAEEVTAAENVKIQQHEGTDDYRILNPYNAVYPGDDFFAPANFVFSVSKNKIVITPGIYDLWPGTGYTFYWDPDNYGNYCNFEYSKEGDAVEVVVNHLIGVGSTPTYVGMFAFDWYGGPLTVE